MFYVMRTHGEINGHWGFTNIGVFKTKKLAVSFSKKHFKDNPSKDKLVVVKAIALIKLNTWKIEEKSL